MKISDFIIFGFRFLKLKFSNNIKLHGKVIIHRKVNIIIEKNANLTLGKNVHIKNNTIIYVKQGAKLFIGDNCSLWHHNEITVGEKIIIGNDNIFAPYVYISDSNHEYSLSDILIRKQGMKSNITIIGSNNWIARGVYILSGARVPDGCILAAGSIIIKEFTNVDMVIGGIPAKEIRSRL